MDSTWAVSENDGNKIETGKVSVNEVTAVKIGVHKAQKNCSPPLLATQLADPKAETTVVKKANSKT